MPVFERQARAFPILCLAACLVWFPRWALADVEMHAVNDGLAVGEAIQHEGLTLYPVLATRELPSGEYLGMQEALSQGSLVTGFGSAEVSSLLSTGFSHLSRDLQLVSQKLQQI